jgi:hypothetical protein
VGSYQNVPASGSTNRYSNVSPGCSITAAYAVMATGIPLGSILLMATVIWNAVSTVVVARTPKGDYAKALRVLRARPSPAPAR